MAAGALVKVAGTAIKASNFLGKGAKKNPNAITTAQKTTKIPSENRFQIVKKSTPVESTNKTSEFNTNKTTEKKSSSNELFEIVKSIEKKVIKIDVLLKNKLELSKKLQTQKRINEEKERYKKQEERLEKPKKFNIKEKPKDLPKLPFLERIKNFIFFTILGMLYEKILPLIPMLGQVFGKAMQAAYFAMEVFGGIANVLTKFLAGGIRLVNGLTKTLAVISGAKTDKEVQEFEKTFNRMIDITILVAMLAGDMGFNVLDLLKKGKKGGSAQAASKAGSVLKGGIGRTIKRAGIKIGGKGGGKAAQGLVKGASSVANKATGGIFAKGAGRSLTRLGIKLGGKGGGNLVKGATGFLGKAAGPIATTVMAGFEFAGRKSSGQSNLQATVGTAAGVGGALAGASAGATVGAAIGSIVPGAGTLVGGAIGGLIGLAGAWAGSTLASKAADKLTGADKVQPTQGYASGGVIKKPSKGKPQQHDPGKDVGGYREITKLFPDPHGSAKGGGGGGGGESSGSVWWNPFSWNTNKPKSEEKSQSPSLFGPKNGALKSLVDTSKTFKKIPFIGELMGVSVDIAMGQKPTKPFYKKLAEGLVYLSQKLSSSESLSAVNGIREDVQKLAEGGVAETVNKDFLNVKFTEKSTEKLQDTLSIIMEKGANDALTDIRKEILQSKFDVATRSSDSSGGGLSDSNFGGDAEATPGEDSGGGDGGNYDDTPHGTPGAAVTTTSGFKAGKGDKSRRIFLHWTAADHNTNFSNYHTTFLSNGRAVRNRAYDVDGNNHTGGANTNSVGLSIAAMGGEGVGPNNFGKYPPTSAQVSAMALEAARLAVAWGWTESTIDSNVRTHGEWERHATGSGILSGKPQRWDLDKLQQSDPQNSGGDKLRKMIKAYFRKLKQGTTTDSSGTTKVTSSGATLREMSLSSATEVAGDVKPGSGGVQISGGGADFWALAAIASLENGNPQGQADVAQSIYNRLLSKLNFGQSSNTIKGHITAPSQYSPVRESNPSLWAAIVDKESAIKAVESHRNGRGRAKKIVEEAAKNIKNPGLQQSAKEFIGGRTDFWATSIGMPPSGHSFIVRHGHRFGYFAGPAAIAYGKKNPPVAEVPSLGVNVTIKPGKPQKPGSGGSVGDPGSGDGKLRFGRTGHLIGMAAGWAHSHFENLRGGMTSQAPTEANLAKLVADASPAIKKMADSGLKPELSSGKAIKKGQDADYYNTIIREGAARHTHSGPKAAVDVNMPGFPNVPFALKDIRNTPDKGEGINALLKNSNTTALYHLSYKKDGMAFHGKAINKQGLFELHKDEFVVDKDSVDLFGQDFFQAINSIENKSKLSKVYPDLIRRIEETAKGKAYVKKEYDQQHGAKVIQADSSSGDSSQKPEDTTKNLEQFNKQEETKTEESQQQKEEDDDKDDKNQSVKVIPASHPQTGSGFTIKGITDSNGRPLILSKGGIKAFGKMIKDSKGAVKGSDVASGKRSVAHNRKVGGVPNSNHLGGNALDIHGTSNPWMRRHGKAYGWIVNDYPGSHGGHFDYKGKGADDSGDTFATKSEDIVTDSVTDFSPGGGGGGSSGGGGGGSSGGGGGGSSPVEVDAEPTESLVPGSKGGGGGGGNVNITLTKNQKEALRILGKYESASAGGYNAVNQMGIAGGRGTAGYAGDFSKMKQHGGKALTDMTVGEILDLQAERRGMSNEEWISQGRLHAVGRYQFIGNTLPGLVANAKLPRNAKFSEEVQDLLALQLMKERGISPWVGPSDHATAAERAIVEAARNDPIKASIRPSKPVKPDKDHPIQPVDDVEKDQQVAGFNSDGKYGKISSGFGDTDGQDTGVDIELFGKRGEIGKTFGNNAKEGPYGNRGVELSFPYELIYMEKIPGGRNAGRKSIDTSGNTNRVVKGTDRGGFGHVGSYFYKDPKSGKMFEVMMGHGNKPFKKFKEGEKIPPGTVLGWQGASGSSDDGAGGLYDHVTFHINAMDGGDPGPIMQKFANSLVMGEGAKLTLARREEKRKEAEIAKKKKEDEKKNPLAKVDQAKNDLFSGIKSTVSSLFGGNKPSTKPKPGAKPKPAEKPNWFQSAVAGFFGGTKKPKIAKAQGGGQIGSPNIKGSQINKFTEYNDPFNSGTQVVYQEKIKYVKVPGKSSGGGDTSLGGGTSSNKSDNSYMLRRN